MSVLTNGLLMLIQTLFGIYLYILLLRFLLQKFGANYYNPVIQVLVKLTDCVVKPVRKIIPSFKGYDLAIVLLVVVLQAVMIGALFYFQLPNLQAWWGLLLVVMGELGNSLMYVFFFAIILQAILSWVPNLQASPLSEILHLLTEPLMKYARRWIPPIAGIDLSAIPVLILLRLVGYVVFNPLIAYGVLQIRL